LQARQQLRQQLIAVQRVRGTVDAAVVQAEAAQPGMRLLIVNGTGTAQRVEQRQGLGRVAFGVG